MPAQNAGPVAPHGAPPNAQPPVRTERSVPRPAPSNTRPLPVPVQPKKNEKR
jgi:hypothetical protein